MRHDHQPPLRFRRVRHHCALAILAGTLWACSDGPSTPPDGSQEGLSQVPLRTTHEALTAPPVVLDVDTKGERKILGTVEPVPANTDAPRVLTITQTPADLSALAGASVLDARLTEEGAVILGADGVLRYVTSDETRELARDVLGPVSVSGTQIAFVQGEPPDLRLARADLDSGQVTQLAPELSTVWSPALSPDGSQIIFVASYGGRPQFFRIEGEGTPQPMPVVEVTPSSPRAPIWRDGYLYFEHEGGVAQLNLTTSRLEAEHPGATIVPGGDRGVRILVDGQVSELGGGQR